MIWLTMRQFRFQATMTLALLAAATVYVVVTGLAMHHGYAVDLAACPHPEIGCRFFLSFQQSYNGQRQLLQMLVIAAPALIGIFWGAPQIATELERGSHRMIWNQSITPARWLAAKTALLGLAALVTAGTLSGLLTWWARPLDERTEDRFSSMVFATHDIAPLGYAAFAFVLGLTVGLFVRRTLPAMAITLAVFIALQILFAAVLRPNLLPSTTTTMPVDASTLSQVGGIGTGPDPSGPVSIFNPGPKDAWLLSVSNVENVSGQEISGNLVGACLDSQSADLAGIGGCLAPYDLHIEYTYQPGRNYWPLQWLETGIYVAFAALLSGACFWRIRGHRD